MKKLGFIFVILTVFMLLMASTASASTLLQYDSVGSDVQVLQTNLNQLGYPVGTVDGQFGLKTKIAVISFQNAQGLTADGVVGAMTQNAITVALQKQARQLLTDNLIAQFHGKTQSDVSDINQITIPLILFKHCVRLLTPSFLYIFPVCAATVLVVMHSSSAISLLE